MKPSSVQRWMVLAAFLGTAVYAIAEDVTLTTYYPSPKGIYQQLQTTQNTYLATQAGSSVGIGTTTAPPATTKLQVKDTTDTLLEVGNNITTVEGVNVRYANRLYPLPLGGGGVQESTGIYARIDPTGGIANHLFALDGEITAAQDDTEAGFLKVVSRGDGDALYVALFPRPGKACPSGFPCSNGVGLETASWADGTKGIISTVQNPAVAKPYSTLFAGLWDQPDVPLYGMLLLDQAVGNAVTVRKRAGAADGQTQIRVWENDLSRERFAVQNDGTTRLASAAVANTSSPPLVLRGFTTGDVDWFIQNRVSPAGVSRLSFQSPAGTERMVITDAGNVGIGTTAPAWGAIHVEKPGDARLWLDADSDDVDEHDNPAILMSQDGEGNAFLIGMVGNAGVCAVDPLESCYADTTDNAMFIGDPGGGGLGSDLQFGVNNAIRMTIDDSTGNVGIGTTSPGSKLSVVGLPPASPVGAPTAGAVCIDTAGNLFIDSIAPFCQ